MSPRGAKSSQKEATLCRSCARAVGGCPWTERDKKTHQVRFAPVEGWEAEKTIIKGASSKHHGKQIEGRKHYYYSMESYHVKKCPLYQKDRRTAAKSIVPGYAIAAQK